MPYYTKDENGRLVEQARARVLCKPAKEIGVLFAYHHTRGPTNANFASFASSNPDSAVVPIRLSSGLVNFGYSRLKPNGFLRWLVGSNDRLYWRNLDAVYYEYYRERSENCKRWLLAEWDLFCNTDLEKFFGAFWDKPFVSTNITGPGWCWFDEVCNMPLEAQCFAAGCAPLAGTLISDECLEKIVLGSWWADRSVFCELRIATLARMSGFELSQHLFGGIGCEKRPEIKGPGLWHPIKT